MAGIALLTVVGVALAAPASPGQPYPLLVERAGMKVYGPAPGDPGVAAHAAR